jgi:hypothetical protein
MENDLARIPMDQTGQLLFTDSSKNFSDLKSRELNFTYYGVIAIIGIAVFVRGFTPPDTRQRVVASILMSLIFAAHWVTTSKCEKNLHVFRERIQKLLALYLPDEPRKLFKSDFSDAVTDEGRITLFLVFSTLLTLVYALFVVWSKK